MRIIYFYNQHVGRVVAVLAAAVAVSVFMYGALLLGAVAHAAGQTSAEDSVRTVSAEVGKLEGSFLSLAKSLSPERAELLGYVQPTAVNTVYAEEASLVLR
jgi:hypothetical protein